MMKIFSFPHVVIYKLMEQFEPVALISLSLCSTRAHALVKTFSRTSEELTVEHAPCHDGYSLSFPGRNLITVATNQTKLLNTTRLQTRHGLNFCFDRRSRRMRRMFTCCADAIQGCRETTNYICDLFKIPLSTVVIFRETDLWLLDFAQRRQEQRLRNVYTSHFESSADSYSRVMRCNATDILDCGMWPPDNYRFDGKLPSAKILTIIHGYWLTREQVLRLESPKAKIGYAHIWSPGINALLRCWLAGEGLGNLKYLKFSKATYDDAIYEGIRDRLERVQGEITYKCDEFKPEVRFTTNNAFHIRRDDGVVATVMYDDQCLVMAVWPDPDGNFY